MESYSIVITAAFTVVLAGATIALALFTKQLVTATLQLTRLQEKERRNIDLKRGLDLIDQLRAVDEVYFAKHLTVPGKIPEPESTLVRQLHLLSRYIGDPDAKLYLRQLVQQIDDVQQGASLGENDASVAKTLKDLKDRLNWSITEWRSELTM